MKTTFIMLDRSILNWRWYKNATTYRVFLHLLLTANIRQSDFEKLKIERGQIVCTQNSLAEKLGLSVQQIRTAISNLKSTGEITVTRHRKFTVITVVNYDYYQLGQQSNPQSSNSQSTVSQQQSNNINNINNTNNINHYLSKFDERVQNSFYSYKNMRTEIGKPLSYLSAIRLLDKLKGITQNASEQVKILEKATDKKWMTVYPVARSSKNGATCEKDYTEYFENAKKLMFTDEDKLQPLEKG